MKFYTTNSTGDSGLFYLGHWINQYFGFPFRVMSADIGIDAEIEILDDSLYSKGLIVKAQVKSTQSSITTNFSEYIEQKHLEYWNKLTVPVIYFKVDLANFTIYQKVISSFDDIEATNSNDENKWKINFDITKDKLLIGTKLDWIEKFKLVEFHNIQNYFDETHRVLKDVNIYVLDDESYFKQFSKLKQAYEILQKLESLKKLYPWKFGNSLNKELENLNVWSRDLNNGLDHEITKANYN